MNFTFRIFFICLLLLILQKADSQSFEGEITYSFTNLWMDSELEQKGISVIGDAGRALQTSKHKLMVCDIGLIDIILNEDGSLKYKTIIDDKKAILQFPDEKPIDYYGSGINGLTLNLSKKTKERKEILGHICRKYKYKSDNGRTKIVAWIAEEILIKDINTLCQLPFYQNLFFPQGLVLEKTVETESMINHFLVEEVTLQDITHKVFYEFYEHFDY